MKVIHLADLHLGKSVLEQSMIEDQKYIYKQIIEIIVKNGVDVVLICGDVYDKTVPSVEAVHLFSDFLTQLSQLKRKVFVIAGNHDSKERLSFGNQLFRENDIYIEGEYEGKVRCVSLSDEYGEMNIYMLPFLKPYEVRLKHPSQEINSYDDAIRVVMENVSVDLEKRNIIMVHQFVTASGTEVVRSDSEVISLGGIDNVDVSNFSSFDYVAMGHVHGPQKLTRDTVRYAGSPLKYSFSEVYQNKSVPIIDFKEKGDIDLELIPLKPLRDMRVIKGNLENLLDSKVVSLGNQDDYISAILTDEDYVMDATLKLRRVYKNLLRLEYQNTRTKESVDIQNCTFEEMEQKSELELFGEFYRNQNNVELDCERSKILQGIIHFVQEKGK